MGQARQRGDFETRKAEAIAAGRVKKKPEPRPLLSPPELLRLLRRFMTVEA